MRSKAGEGAVDPRNIFQIGSTTKAFLATSMALMADRGKLHWDDRVVDLEPDFQLKDPWVHASSASSTLAALGEAYANDGRRRWAARPR